MRIIARSIQVPFSFDVRLFPVLAAGFIIFTVIGTLTHEWGHYMAGRFVGYSGHVNYKSTSFDINKKDILLDSLYRRCVGKKEIGPHATCPEVEGLLSEQRFASAVIYAGGPMQTMLTGTLALLALFIVRKRSDATAGLTGWQWMLVFLSLFWLRQVLNSALVFWNAFVNYSLGKGDEMNLSLMFQLHPLTLNLLTGVIGVVVFLMVLYRFIPPVQRLTFLCSGVAGSFIGYYIWFDNLGPVLMP